MARKKRKGISIGKQIIIVSSIIALNLVGVTYAYWNVGTSVESTVDTGYINPIFRYHNFNLNGTKDTLYIYAELEPNEQLTLNNIEIVDEGTVPFKYVGCDIVSDNYESITILSNSDINKSISIQAPSLEGSYDFKINLFYTQFNDVGWEKTLTIEGLMQVKHPPEILITNNDIENKSIVENINVQEGESDTCFSSVNEQIESESLNHMTKD